MGCNHIEIYTKHTTGRSFLFLLFLFSVFPLWMISLHSRHYLQWTCLTFFRKSIINLLARFCANGFFFAWEIQQFYDISDSSSLFSKLYQTRVQASSLSFPDLISTLPQIGLRGLYRGSIPAILGQFSRLVSIQSFRGKFECRLQIHILPFAAMVWEQEYLRQASLC